jgi:hypothetical protein
LQSNKNHSKIPIIVFDNRSNFPDFFSVILNHTKFQKYFLLGHQSNKIKLDKKNYINLRDFDSYNEKIKLFDDQYKHRSSNSIQMELACFQRFIALSFVMEEFDLPYAWHLDTDVWSTPALDDIAAYAIDKKVDFMGSQELNDTMSINAGCSFFSRSAAISLSEYLLRNFEIDNHEELDKIYEIMRINGAPGGICDMTALMYWVKASPQINYLNTYNKEIAGYHINHNFNSILDELGTTSTLQIVSRNRRDCFLLRSGSNKIKFAALHFAGHSKNYIFILQFSRLLIMPFAFGKAQMRIVRKLRTYL